MTREGTTAAFGQAALAAMMVASVVGMGAGCTSDPPPDDPAPSKPRRAVSKKCAQHPYHYTPAYFQRPSAEVMATVSGLFRRECASCHAGESAPGGIDIFENELLRRRGLLDAPAESSRLYAVAAGLPAHLAAWRGGLVEGRPASAVTEAELAALRAWFDGCAPSVRGDRTPLSLEDYDDEVNRDSFFMLSSPDRVGMVAYLDLRAIYNNDQYSNAEYFLLLDAALARLRGCAGAPFPADEAGDGDGVTVLPESDSWPVVIRLDLRRSLITAGDLERLVVLSGRRAGDSTPCDALTVPLLDFLYFSPWALPACAAGPPAPAGLGDFGSLYSQSLTPTAIAAELGFPTREALLSAARDAPRVGPSPVPALARGLSREAFRGSYEGLLALTPRDERHLLRACALPYMEGFFERQKEGAR